MKKDHERLEKTLAETQAEKRKLQEPLQKVVQTWGDNSNSKHYMFQGNSSSKDYMFQGNTNSNSNSNSNSKDCMFQGNTNSNSNSNSKDCMFQGNTNSNSDSNSKGYMFQGNSNSNRVIVLLIYNLNAEVIVIVIDLSNMFIYSI